MIRAKLFLLSFQHERKISKGAVFKSQASRL
jgi:hypothetical protein